MKKGHSGYLMVADLQSRIFGAILLLVTTSSGQLLGTWILDLTFSEQVVIVDYELASREVSKANTFLYLF